MSLFVRAEPFGAVVSDAAEERLYFVDHFAFEVFQALSRGANIERVHQAALKRFPVGDHPTAVERIDAISRFVFGKDRTALTIRHCSGDVGAQMPTLSAPLDLYWEITRRCNETCVHCYNNSSPHGFNPDITDIQSIAEELAPYPLRNITLTGGEPMMRRDFWDIVDFIRPLTRELTMGTNGTLISQANIDRVNASFDTLNISLDDPSPSEFDKFRGYSGAFRKTIEALELLSDTAIRINVQTVLTRDSISRLGDLGQLLESIRVDNWIVRFAFESGRAVGGREHLTGKEIFEFGDYLAEIKHRFEKPGRMVKIGANYPWSYKEPYPYVPPGKDLQTCAAATTHAAIDAFGRMAPCSLFTETDFRTDVVYGGSFLRNWREALQFTSMRELRRRDVKGCGTCANAAGICGGGCRAKAYMRYGTILKNDYSCNYSN